MSDWKEQYREWEKKSKKRVRKTLSETDKNTLDGKNCSVCLVLRRGEQPLLGRYLLDGSELTVCDRCLATILSLKFEHPEETEGRQWNWEPIKKGLRMGLK